MTVEKSVLSEEAGVVAIGQQEAYEPTAALLEKYGATWNGADDSDDPYNWTSLRKISIAVIISSGQLVTLMSASMVAPALHQIAEDVGMDISTTQICFSIFILGLAFAPFLIAALSEMYGRKPVWLFCNAWYIVWNSLCPVGDSKALMILGRFMAGSGASAGVCLTGPIMADMYRAKDRGKSLAIAGLLPYLGPALGPIVGGLASQNIHWHWLFWILSIFDAAIMILGVLVVAETYTPILLRRKAKAQNPSLYPPTSPWTRAFYADLFSRLRANLGRPLRLLVKSPVIQLISLVFTMSFGVYTIVLSTFAGLWIDRYGQPESISSLHYIAIAAGFTLASQGGGRIMDLIWRRLRDRHPNRAPTPEYRVPYMVPAVLIAPIGLFWYGWAAEHGAPWPVVDIGVVLFTLGEIVLAQPLLGYLLDEFEHDAASAGAAVRMPSYVAGFAFPIFAPQLYLKLGYGWGNSLLGFVFLAVSCPIPFIFWYWGAKLRSIGRS